MYIFIFLIMVSLIFLTTTNRLMAESEENQFTPPGAGVNKLIFR
jgi:hypothetical protein